MKLSEDFQLMIQLIYKIGNISAKLKTRRIKTWLLVMKQSIVITSSIPWLTTNQISAGLSFVMQRKHWLFFVTNFGQAIMLITDQTHQFLEEFISVMA